ncbi:Carrier protein, mitochondrial [Coemansia spiralis]|uniref:Carrier protein, mitochondrial n=1 Tax=Coemansia spiralis TaxID=417178 RepID=A0A9W8KTN1_9FUNG|nr:Carrier protein, mitochondrial [Coemansia spiralis]
MPAQAQSSAAPSNLKPAAAKAAPEPETPGLKSRIVSACTGAVITSLLMTPFDVVKTRQQSQTLVRADPLIPAVREWRATHYWVPRNARDLVDSALYSYLREEGSIKDSSTRSAKLRPLASQLCLCLDPSVSGSARLWPQELLSAEHTLPSTGAASVQAGSRINGTIAGMQHIARTEGIATLWRGLSPTLVASGPSTVIYFVGYDYLRQWIGNSMLASDRLAPYEKYASLVAGCAARTAAATAISPIELVRTRMQASATHDFRTVLQGISAEINKGGIGTLWRGLVPTLWRDVPFSAIYWFGYERWRARVYEPLFAYSEQGMDMFSRLAVAFCSGASSGIVAAALTIPFDVAKTRRQIEQHANPKSNVVQHNSLGQVIRHIVSTEGPRGLFAGLAPRLMKVAPSCAIMISSYELGKVLLSAN